MAAASCAQAPVVRYLDHLADGRYAVDGASGVFSLVGRRARAIDYGDIIAYYDNLDRSMEARAPVPPRPRVLSPQR